VGVNVANAIDSPTVPAKDPDPPSAEEAAKVLKWAWKRDPEWGTYLWLAMVTGCRRGELIGLQWAEVDFAKRILTVAFSEQVLKRRRQRRKRRRKDTKTHQQRRISFDSDTAELLLALRAAAQEHCAALGVELPETAYLFSRQPDGSEPLLPDSVTQRYKRLAIRLGLRSHRLHSLRHYTATELVAAGVDLRTIAGRLGHGSGGATTLRVYSAWAPEADQRAASLLGKHLPRPGRRNDSEPVLVNGMALRCRCGNVAEWMSLRVDGFQVIARCAECGIQVAGVDPRELEIAVEVETDESNNPYRKIASELRDQIAQGELQPGESIPTMKQLAQTYGVAWSTAQRAVKLLADDGLVVVRSGVRTRVRLPGDTQ
jgi:site-specific recombinase XerD